MSRFEDNAAYWDKNQHKFPLQGVLKTGSVDPTSPRIGGIMFMCVPFADGFSRWGFETKEDKAMFLERIAPLALAPPPEAS
mgnify:CR=1 FL=1